jgi:4-diphosphocytidyl-2-C-methyl-D-erythritol kinase
MPGLNLKSYAKINLSLKVLGIREDRYHEIDSEMQSVSLYDEVLLELSENGINVICAHPKVPGGEGNIAYKAARAFLSFAKINKGVRITIKKSIPAAAGLAGGSSNAAAVIAGLDRLFDTRISAVQLSSIGADVGSDVPFCLIGGRARVRGRGEVVELLPALPKMHFLLVVPDLEVPTKWAYEEYDRWSLKAKGTLKQSPQGISQLFYNDFEPAISLKFPAIKKIEEVLLKSGAIAASMSGSGPSVFCICNNEGHAKGMLAKLKDQFPQSFLVESVDRGIEFI